MLLTTLLVFSCSVHFPSPSHRFFFFFNDTATTEIYTLSLHDALPISAAPRWQAPAVPVRCRSCGSRRSEEHTSELQSQSNLVCRLLLEKKKKKERSLNPVFQK